MLGFIGRISNGKTERVYNRELYPDLAISQCINQRELSALISHFGGDHQQISEQALQSITAHAEQCEDCKKEILSAIGFSHDAIQIAGIQSDSLHTSLPPDQPCRPFCKVRQARERITEIHDWTEVH